ncbi:hypothetical protein C7212DRAFT_346264 [Tuber magnatum]|uniref:Uncharacterized protein n=1 Tax=Tuber magnatum TaxID=42249 RepID=A0A317SJZ8_9PEZI|nr:hypothetical protein C7212DRAFT_346264 [Tuber magnatum]
MVKQQNQRQQMRHEVAALSIVEQASVAQNGEGLQRELCNMCERERNMEGPYSVAGVGMQLLCNGRKASLHMVGMVIEDKNRDELPQQVKGIEAGLPGSSLLEGRIHVLEEEVAIELHRVHGLEVERRRCTHCRRNKPLQEFDRNRQGNIYKTCHSCL